MKLLFDRIAYNEFEPIGLRDWKVKRKLEKYRSKWHVMRNEKIIKTFSTKLGAFIYLNDLHTNNKI